MVDQLGEDLNRLAGVLDTLVAAFGPGTRLDVDDVAPYLGDGGGIPPWDLTDAIDRGDREVALGALARMLRAGGRHPLVVMAILHSHYGRLLRLDGSGATDEASAGAVLGLKGFAARKALDRARAMGPEAIHDAIELLANADADLRGRRELPRGRGARGAGGPAVPAESHPPARTLAVSASGGRPGDEPDPRSVGGRVRSASSAGSCAGRPGSCG